MKIVLILLFSPFLLLGQLKAFPTAEGAAKYLTGGRGGQVIHVTNLNDSGPGSFREALETTGTRTIVFDVSGTIVTESTLWIGSFGVDNGNLTIAGQTAPMGGITIKGYNLIIDSSFNVIIRYLRFRGDKAKQTWGSSDNISFWWSGGILLDHVSASYGGDENMDIGNGGTEVDNITVQRSVIGEGKTGMIAAAENPSSTGLISVVKNVFVNVHHRTPNIGSDFHAEVVNNIMYNWQTRLSTNTKGSKTNYINNYYKTGIMTPPINEHSQNANILPASYSQKIYNSGNYWEGKPTFTSDNWLGWTAADASNFKLADQSGLQSTFDNVTRIVVDEPITDIMTAEEAYVDVLANVGANATLDENGNKIEYIDSVDQTHFTDILNGTYVNQTNGNYQWYETSVYDYGNPPNNTRAAGYDTDGDGIPNAYETSKGWSTTVANNAVVDASGYTQLELYLNEIDGAVVVVEEPATPLPTYKRKRIRIGTTKLPFFYFGTNKILN